MTTISDLKDAIVNKCNNLINSHNSNNNAHNTLFSNKINVSDVVDDLITSDGSKPLSAKQGKILKELLDSIMYNVSLTSDKTRISAFDSEYVLLTATVTNSQSAPVASETVTFYKGSTVLGTATTDNNGVATISYSAVGDGVLTFTAEVETITSANLIIEDALFYDSCSSDRTSEYSNPFVLSGTNATTTLSYDNGYTAYKLVGSGNWYAGIPILSDVQKDEILLEMEFYTSINNWRNGAGFYLSDPNNYALIYYLEGDNKFRTDGTLIPASCSFYSNNSNCNHRGQWCKANIVLDFNNNNATINITDSNDNVLLSTSYSFSTTSFNPTNGVNIGLMHIAESGTTNSIIYMKNIKIY